MAKTQAQIDDQYLHAAAQRKNWQQSSAAGGGVGGQGDINAQRVMQSLVQESAEIRASGGGGGGNATPVDPNAYAKQLEAARQEDNRKTAVAMLTEQLGIYGMGSLVPDLDRIVRSSGNNASVAMNQIRQTKAYKDRFKGLLALQTKGINDVTSEAEYISLESGYRGVFRDSGIQSFLGAAGSTAERDAIADIVGNFSLSVNEVKDRVSDAQRVVNDTSQEVRDSFQKFYNVDPSVLTAYVLDPGRTTSEINRRANAAIVAGLGVGSGLDLSAGVSEKIGSLFSGGNDLNSAQAQPELTIIGEAAKATKRLANIEQKKLSDDESALARLDLDLDAKTKVEGLKSRERARFGGASAFGSESLKSLKKI